MTTKELTRRTDPATIQAAAQRILPHRSRLQSLVYQHIGTRPAGCTAGEVERHQEFARYGCCTIRKRCSELKRLGYLKVDSRRDGMSVFFAVSESTVAAQLERKRGGRLF